MKRSNSMPLLPYRTPRTTGPFSAGSHDATVVSVRRRALTGTADGSKRSRTIGWRVGIQENSSAGTSQSGAPMFSPNVKWTSWARSMSTRARAASSMVPARYAGIDDCVYMGSLSRNATRVAAKYSSRIQHDAETWRNRSADRQNSTTCSHDRPYVWPAPSR